MSGDEITRLQQAFERDGCLKSFIELRRLYPEHKIRAHPLADFEFLTAMGDFLKEHGIEFNLIVGIAGGREKDIEELSLQLLERVYRQQDLKKQGQTHIKSRNTGLSDALINYLTVMMLERVESLGTRLPPSLLVLARQRLRGHQPKLQRTYQTRRRKMDAIYIALQLQEKGLEPSLNQIAKAMGVEPSTVSRWFPNGSLLEECEQCWRKLRGMGWTLERVKHAWHMIEFNDGIF